MIVDRPSKAKSKNPDSPFLGVAEMAIEFGLNESTVRKMVRQKLLPHTRIGRTIVFDRDLVRESLQAAMKANCTGELAGA